MFRQVRAQNMVQEIEDNTETVVKKVHYRSEFYPVYNGVILNMPLDRDILDLGFLKAFDNIPEGSRVWFNRIGLIDRDNGPAVILPDAQIHCKDGQIHREDGPAIIYTDSEEWWQYDQLHREDGPAVIDNDGSTRWYIDGKLHRDDGPAIEESTGYKAWYQHGKLHREDGPAVVWPDGREQWFIDDQYIKTDSYLMRTLKDIYELTYKYQMLKQEQERGDYGLPQVLPDQAYLEFEKIKHSLKTELDSMYDPVVETYEGWLDERDSRHPAYYDVEAMLSRFTKEYKGSLDEKIILFQEALTTAHNNGQMADHLLGLDDGEGVEFLSNLSENSPVEEWNNEIGSVLGYYPGTRKEQDTMYTPRAFKQLLAALRILGINYA